MSDSPRFDPLASRAYVLFRSELAEHLGRIEAMTAREGAMSADEVDFVGRTFHTIKGGAGFFGLNDIARAAGRLETLFLESDLRDWGEVRRLLEALGALSGTLPEPKGGTDRCPTS